MGFICVFLYITAEIKYNTSSKVDDARQVLRLGKSVDERTHLFCGASFGPLRFRV